MEATEQRLAEELELEKLGGQCCLTECTGRCIQRNLMLVR